MATADVSTPCAAYVRMSKNWQLVSDLMGGTDTMRAAGDKWLPREPKETRKAFDNRLNRTVLYNGFKRSIRSLVGRPFSKPVQLGDDVPEDIKLWWENIDLAGRHGDIFARDAFLLQVADGMCHMLVEYPKTEGKVETLADERDLGVRPYVVLINPRDVVNWRSEIRDGRRVLTRLHIKESYYEPDGEWGEQLVDRVRVLEPGSFRVYQRKSLSRNADWELVEEGTTSLNRIPFVTVYGHRTGFMEADPPLMDLAHLNVQHWQSCSDQQHILHVARVPILFGSGFAEASQGKSIEVSPNTAILSDNPSANLRYVEHTGTAIAAGQQDLTELENRMAVMGADLLATKAATLTATQSTLDSISEDADLAAMVRGLEDGLEEVLSLMAEYVGRPAEFGGSVTINKDFAITLRDSTDLQILLQARTANAISQETFLKELLRRGVLDPAIDVEEEMDKAKTEAPPEMGGAGTAKPLEEMMATENEM